MIKQIYITDLKILFVSNQISVNCKTSSNDLLDIEKRPFY